MSEPVLLSNAVEDYLTARAARYSQSTVQNEGHVLRRFAATVVGGRDIQVRNLTADHVEAWFVTLRSPHTDRAGVARPSIQAASWNYYRARIKSFVMYCSRRGWTRADLLAYVDPMTVSRKVRQQPSPSHLWAMLDNASDPRDRAVLAMAMNTGLRSNEIARLRVGDLDLQDLSLRVRISKSRMEDLMPVTADLDAEMRVWLIQYASSIERPLRLEDLLLPARTGPRYYWRKVEGVMTKGARDSTYVPHRPVTKLHRIAQQGLRSVGLPTRHEGIHTLRRAVARAYYDSLKTEGHETAIRAVMVLLHHSNQSTTEVYLGITAERQFRDESLRGRHLIPRPASADVVDLTSRLA